MDKLLAFFLLFCYMHIFATDMHPVEIHQDSDHDNYIRRKLRKKPTKKVVEVY